MIKEPEVNGVIFKSLTHAKWSIFFSNIECEWEYRPEGFTLDNGNFFIPDFKVTYFDQGMKNSPIVYWFLVKDKNELTLLDVVYCYSFEEEIVICVGSPDVTRYKTICDYVRENESYSSVFNIIDRNLYSDDDYLAYLFSHKKRPWHDEKDIYIESFIKDAVYKSKTYFNSY